MKKSISLFIILTLIISILPIMTVGAWTINYAVTGGELVFDEPTGSIIGYTGSPTSVVVPNKINGVGVTSISMYAFPNCRSMTSIILPNSVTSIGDYAFSGCRGLTSITIPDSVISIGDYAFKNCISITNIVLPDSVTSIGANAFAFCLGLTSIDASQSNSTYYSVGGVLFNKDKTTIIAYPNAKGSSYVIPNSVTSIGGYVFYGCSKLTSITIPKSVTSIGDYAFYSCTSLTSINVDLNNLNYCSSDGVLFNKDKTTIIAYPNAKGSSYVIPNSVTSIGGVAFSACSSLTSIVIPNSVISIGGGAFSACSGLTNIVIPNSVASIGGGAFSSCSSVTSITIPDSVISIGERAFESCWKLTNIAIPNSVISIGDSAFSSCSSVTEITLQNSVTSIGEFAFSGCSSVTNIIIPNSVTSIGNYSFYGCSSLTNITILNSVTGIGNGAFDACSNLTVYSPKNSTAQNYTTNNNIKFIPLFAPILTINNTSSTTLSSGAIKLNTKIINNSADTNMKATLMIGIYNADKTLISSKVGTQFTTVASNAIFDLNVETSLTDEQINTGCYIKVFLIDATNSLKPLEKAYVINKTGIAIQ